MFVASVRDWPGTDGDPVLYWRLLGHGFAVAGVPRTDLRRFSSVLRATIEPVETIARWVLAPDAGSWVLKEQSSIGDACHRGTIEELLLRLEFLAISKAFDCWPNPPWLHAALVARGRFGVVVIGPKESGKSTLAAALWQAGWTLISDDGVVLVADGRVTGVPRRVSLRSGGAALLARSRIDRLKAMLSWQPRSDGCVFHPDEVTGTEHPTPVVDPCAVVFLKRLGSAANAAMLSPLNGAAALTSGMTYSNVIQHAGVPEALQAFAPLFLRVPAYDLRRCRLSDMVAAVDRLADDHTTDRQQVRDVDVP